ncbi:helix-turn-helix domain-containing protein [Xylanimonas ulmi]|uniref:HxlR family transcriptional regulator n=2 Tax=Xylanimonas ulmi TaxID=228973 RepID=A0A4Q7LYB9_9MICO|nr:HxlR family transcriptional regulator [Xylanibacterium ulmi]
MQILDDEACRAFQSAMEIVGKRWTGAIMLAISRGSRRFGEILRVVAGLSDRLLSQRLKELAAHGLVTRTIVPTTPAYSEYTLTPLGEELIEAMQPLVTWGYLHPLPSSRPE